MRFMELPALKPNHHWENVSPLGEIPEWKEVRGDIETVDPLENKLVGYDEKDFLAKQYK